MAPPLPKKVPASKRDSKGFANPLYDEEESASGTQASLNKHLFLLKIS